MLTRAPGPAWVKGCVRVDPHFGHAGRRGLSSGRGSDSVRSLMALVDSTRNTVLCPRTQFAVLGLAREGQEAEDVTAMGASIWGLSKRGANYRPAPKPAVRCDACKYMFPRLALGGCRLVRGVIQGSATCDEFTPRNWK